MENLSEYVGKLVVLRCWCGVQHAVPSSLRNEQMRQRDIGITPFVIYCPLGHTHVPGGESEADKLRRQLASKQAYADQLAADLREKTKSLVAQKGQTTKARKRAAAGLCPYCSRSFAATRMAAHVKTKHPEHACEESK